MNRPDSPAGRAYWQLIELARQDWAGDAQLFALTWLAAGRMVVTGKAKSVPSVERLADVHFWTHLINAGLPAVAYDLTASQRASALAHDIGRRASAAAIVSELAEELGQHRWDVLPCLTDTGGRRGDAEGTVVPALASLLMDLLGAAKGSEVWIPFDLKGQLTIEALRRGLRVATASPLATPDLTRQLLLTIETGVPQPSTVRSEIVRDPAGRPVTRARYAIVMPPFGMPVKDSRMTTWDVTGTRAHEQYARSEAWAVFEFANRVDGRALFVTPQGVLFSKGQEQRLREYLLHRGGECNELDAVVTLPPGVFGGTSIAGAIVVFSPHGASDDVYMADLGSGRRSLGEADDIVAAGSDDVLSRVVSDKAVWVSRDDITATKCSFAPSRYLSRVAELVGDVATLDEVCKVIRPPATSKEVSPYEASEMGLADLQKWQPVAHEFAKKVHLKSPPSDAVLLQPGDVVISIKGSVGRVGLVGSIPDGCKVVLSQSCLALRLNPELQRETLAPEVLLMYLRSPHGQAQLAGLQVGATVQHISPDTLMSSVVIPLPAADAYVEILRDFERLCEIEQMAARLERDSADIARRHWPDERQ